MVPMLSTRKVRVSSTLMTLSSSCLQPKPYLKCYMKKGRGAKIRIIDAQLSVVITVNTQYRHHQCNFMLLQNWSPREVILILTRVHEQRVVGIICAFFSLSTEKQKKLLQSRKTAENHD